MKIKRGHKAGLVATVAMAAVGIPFRSSLDGIVLRCLLLCLLFFRAVLWVFLKEETTWLGWETGQHGSQHEWTIGTKRIYFQEALKSLLWWASVTMACGELTAQYDPRHAMRRWSSPFQGLMITQKEYSYLPYHFCSSLYIYTYIHTH